jgi:hypothetical protein
MLYQVCLTDRETNQVLESVEIEFDAGYMLRYENVEVNPVDELEAAGIGFDWNLHAFTINPA